MVERGTGMGTSGSTRVEDHAQAVRELLQGIADGVEQVSLLDALGRRLATDLQAPVNLPMFDNSQMDGYAVSSVETIHGEPLTVVPPVPAGYAAPAHLPGTAVPVMTGAMMPPGADAVVPIEQAVPDEFLPAGTDFEVRLPANVPAGQFVRSSGTDIRAGELALPANRLLGPAQLGLAAALGIDFLPVRRRPRILLISTGDEIVRPGGVLRAGQIFDANSTILAASCQEAGAEVLMREISVDSVEAFLGTLDRVLAENDVDLVVTSGGISAGAYEVVRQALEAKGVRFGPVNIQPGGPQAIGTYLGVPFLGFPGNPVSAWVSFEVFLRPVLADLGTGVPARRRFTALVGESLDSPRGKHQFRRALVVDGMVRPIGGPGSHLLRAMSEANALIHIQPDVERLEMGESVDVMMTGFEDGGEHSEQR